jgi:FtsH-binding integral membrane protein
MLGNIIDRLIAQNDEFSRHWRTPLGVYLRNRNRFNHQLYLTTLVLRLTTFILATLIKTFAKVHKFVLSSMELTLILMGALLFAAIFTRGDGEMPGM